MTNDTVLRCLRCGFTDPEALTCPHCGQLTSAVYLAGNTCRECRLKANVPDGDRETYTVSDDRVGTYTFDVTKARVIAKIHDRVQEIPEEMLAAFLQTNVTEPRHYDHIRTIEPGIVGVIDLDARTSTLVLIDGSHRAAVCYRDRKPFAAYTLPSYLVQQCVLEFQPGEGL